MKIPKRYWAIHGCSTHVAKKYPPPYIDGWEFTWKDYFSHSTEWKKLRGGHILWNPYTRGWGTIKKVEYCRVPIWGLGSRPRKMRSRRVIGWYTECHIYLEDGFVLYGVDQWQCYYCTGIPPEQREEFFAKLAQFNAQFGKDPLWSGPFYNSVLSREDWERVMDEPNDR